MRVVTTSLSRGPQEAELIELAKRHDDGIVGGGAIDLESTDELVGDLDGRVLTITPLPHEAGRGVELVNLVRRAVEHDDLAADGARVDVRSLAGSLVAHAARRAADR